MTGMKEHEGIQYYEIEPGKWRVRLPSGFKSTIEVESEDELKQKISELKAQISGN